MFTYIHCYMPQTFDAYVKKGFFGKNDGVKIHQIISLNDSKKFNMMAAKGSVLHSIIKNLNCFFYVDRLQGGCFYEDYPFDLELISEYQNILGDKFLGFQMHEWMSNFKSDLDRITSCCADWNQESIEKSILKTYPYPYVYLESQTVAEFSSKNNPQTIEEFLKQSVEMFSKRQKSVNGLILPCDSAYMAPKLEIELGAKTITPEIGAQTANTRIQISYMRGMSRAYGIPFGTYYEPWGGAPFSACYYKKDNINEWGIGESKDFPFVTQGENGGSSRSLQKRLHLYSYLSGARFISEEWGMCNTFYDWNDFEITPYGKVKLDFLRFVDRNPDIGKQYTPIAVVLPSDLRVLDLFSKEDEYLGYPVSGDKLNTIKIVRKGLEILFAASSDMLGNETKSMVNSRMPDAFDIIHEDNTAALKNYEYLVDLTSNPLFSKKHNNICDIHDVTDILHLLLPVNVKGDIHWFVNKKTDGRWLLTIFNNSGIDRSVEKGELTIPEAAKSVEIFMKDGATLKRIEGSDKISFNDNKYTVTIDGGDWFFAEF